MDRGGARSSEMLDQVKREIARISELQHRLARRKTVLQEHATRLRLGGSAAAAQMALLGEVDGSDEWSLAEPNALVAEDEAV
jgi:hypothetical protein